MTRTWAFPNSNHLYPKSSSLSFYHHYRKRRRERERKNLSHLKACQLGFTFTVTLSITEQTSYHCSISLSGQNMQLNELFTGRDDIVA
jgi:hypothetical protein